MRKVNKGLIWIGISMWKSMILGLAVSALLLVGVRPAKAGVTIYNTKAAFLAATNPGFYENFFLTDNGFELSPIDFGPVNGFKYRATAAGDFFSQPSKFSTNVANDPITFTMTGAPVTAIGGDFWLTDIDFNTIKGTITITLNDGTTVNLLNATPTTFEGFTSDVAITSLTLTTGEAGAFNTANDFIVGTAAAVPEPSTLTLLGLGTLSLFGYTWRRRRTA
jgi:hypothetical protein